jgi:hypothetical protein
VGFVAVARWVTIIGMDTRDGTAAAEAGLTEQQVVAAAGTGKLVDLRAGAARTVRAELLAELLVAARTPPGGGRLRAVRLRGARITGQLDLEAATLGCPLLLWDCHLEQPINLKEARAPAVRLPGCHLPGLAADQLETRGNLELNSEFTATGEVGLVGAHIGGDLRLSSASLTNHNGPALFADGLTVDQAMFCRDGFTATGEVRLVGAHIGGSLEFDGAGLTNPDGRALFADGLTVEQSMYCRDGFTATGEVNLLGAHIGAQLGFGGASLTNHNGPALFADRLTVDQSMHCGKGFTATGEVRLLGAKIGGQLSFKGATLANPGRVALNLQEVRTTALLLLPRKRPDGIVDLTAAKVGSFHDDQASWPARLRLRAFVYDTLENDRVGVRDRLGWLRRHQDGYTPQPYEQLAAAYRRDGRDEAARRVLVAKQWRRRGRLNPWNWLLYATVGYGYRTWLAALWLLLALWAGTRALDQAQQAGLLAPAKDNPSQQSTFHPLTYALDLLLPIVNLGQEGAWIPRGWAERWTWGLVLAGWVLTTAVVAGLTGVLKRD